MAQFPQSSSVQRWTRPGHVDETASPSHPSLLEVVSLLVAVAAALCFSSGHSLKT